MARPSTPKPAAPFPAFGQRRRIPCPLTQRPAQRPALSSQPWRKTRDRRPAAFSSRKPHRGRARRSRHSRRLRRGRHRRPAPQGARSERGRRAPAVPMPRESGPQPFWPRPSGPPTASAPAPISAERAAQDAVAELLGSDIRVLFVALGSASGAAIEAAARPGVAIGADFPSTDPPATRGFRITPDDRGLAESLAREGKILLGRPRAGDSSASTMPSLSNTVPSNKKKKKTSRS